MNETQRDRLKQRMAQRAAEATPLDKILTPPEPAPEPALPVCPSCGLECAVWNARSRCCNAHLPATPLPADQPVVAQPGASKSRLPPGSIYSKHWDGVVWTVILHVPATDGRPQYDRTSTGSGSIKAETQADDLYRQWLATQDGAA